MANKAYPPSICPGIPRLGKCPTGWSTCTFGDILTVVERPVPVDDDTVYQLVTAKRNRGGIVPREQLKGREIKTQGQYTVRAGDFLIANRQIIHGACGIVPESLDGALVSGEYTVLLPKKNLWLPWLAHFAHTVHFQQTCFQSSIGVDVEKMVFKVGWWLKQRLHMPPLVEQKRIVSILSTWDAAIEQTRLLADAAQRRKKALMQQLLTGKRRLPGFRDSWKHKLMSEVCQPFLAGATPPIEKREYWGGSIPWISGADVGEGVIRYGRRGITEEAVRVTKTLICEPDDIAFLTRTGVGKWALVTRQTAVSQDITRVRFISNLIMPQFGQYALASITASLSRRRQGTSISGIKKEDLESAILLAPSLQEQNAIAAVLSKADDETRALETKAAALERQKMGLMQKLLIGKVRVKA